MKWLCPELLPMPMGVCPTNHVDGTRPFAEDDGGKDHGTGATDKTFGSLRNFINTDDVKALKMMGDAWNRAFNDTVARVNPQYKKACPKFAVLDNSALTWKP